MDKLPVKRSGSPSLKSNAKRRSTSINPIVEFNTGPGDDHNLNNSQEMMMMMVMMMMMMITVIFPYL